MSLSYWCMGLVLFSYLLKLIWLMSLSGFNFGPNCSLQSFSCQLMGFRVYIGVLKTLICKFSQQNVGARTELFLCILP